MNKATFGSLALFHKTCATEVFIVKLRCFYKMWKPEILVFSYALLAYKTRSSTRPAIGARCYQLICTIVGLAEEPPFNKHDKCLCSSISNDSPLCLANFGKSIFCLNNYDHGPAGFVIKRASRVFFSGLVS